MKCSVKDCSNDATQQIGFKFYALGFPKKAGHIISHTGIAVCDECKPLQKRENLLTPEGCARINNALTSIGKAAGDLANAELLFFPFVDGEMPHPLPAR